MYLQESSPFHTLIYFTDINTAFSLAAPILHTPILAVCPVLGGVLYTYDTNARTGRCLHSSGSLNTIDGAYAHTDIRSGLRDQLEPIHGTSSRWSLCSICRGGNVVALLRLDGFLGGKDEVWGSVSKEEVATGLGQLRIRWQAEVVVPAGWAHDDGGGEGIQSCWVGCGERGCVVQSCDCSDGDGCGSHGGAGVVLDSAAEGYLYQGCGWGGKFAGT